MARKSVAKPTVDAVDENMDAETVDIVDSQVADVAEEAKTVEETKKKSANKDALKNDDIIKVVSIIPNVSYKDKRTGDIYKWESVGEEVEMTFDVVNYMWQNSKSYFRNMWIKPLDERVIKKFSLESVYRDYDYLMDVENYTRSNVNNICDAIRKTPSLLKFSICNKVKNLVSSGELSDIHVLREIEKSLNIDLINLIA